MIAFGCASCPKLTCGREGCGTEFCYHCKQIWHPNQTCDAARQERAQSLRLRTIRSSSISYSQESGAAGIYVELFLIKYLTKNTSYFNKNTVFSSCYHLFTLQFSKVFYMLVFLSQKHSFFPVEESGIEIGKIFFKKKKGKRKCHDDLYN